MAGTTCEVPLRGRIGKPVQFRHRARCGDQEVAGHALAQPLDHTVWEGGRMTPDLEVRRPASLKIAAWCGRAAGACVIAGLYDVINARRDVRREFTGAAVADDVLLRILSAAHAAPSVGLTQPWDFVLVRDRGLQESFQEHVAEERAVFEATLPAERRSTFANIKIEGILESGLGIVVTYDCERGAPAVLGRNTIADAGLYSTCLAIQNLWLAATAEGLGIGWVSFYREEFLRDLLAIPRHVRPVAWLCAGPVSQLASEPDLERYGWRSRRPLADAVHLNSYRS